MTGSALAEPAGSDRQGGPLHHLLVLLAVLFPWLCGLVLFSSTFDEDSYITCWVADRFADTGRILNYNGDALEQSSSLGWVLALAALVKLSGSSAAVVAPILSMLAASVAVWLVYRASYRSAAAAWLFASSVPVVFWSLSGNEAVAQAGVHQIWLLALARMGRGAAWGRVLFAFATLVLLLIRPENSVSTVACCAAVLAYLVTSGVSADVGGRVLQALCLVVLLALALAGWRWLRFGAFMPQPVVAKVDAIRLERLLAGAFYLREHAFFRIDLLLWCFGFFGAIRVLRRRLPDPDLVQVGAVAVLSTQLAFVVFSGGDWMPAGRFLIVALACCAVLWTQAIAGATNRRAHTLVLVAVVLQCVAVLQRARTGSSGSPIWASPDEQLTGEPSRFSWFELRNRSRVHDMPMIHELERVLDTLQTRTSAPLTVLSGQAGMVMYHVVHDRGDSIRFLDRFSLATDEFDRCEVFSDLPRTSIGVDVRYPALFERLHEAESRCNLARPEVIWDWDSAEGRVSRLVARQGYRLVYEQDGFLKSGSKWLPGADQRANEFIAIREDLWREGDQHVVVTIGQD